MNSAAASTNPTPTNITLLVNRNRVNPDSLVGLTLTTLEAVLSNTDEHFSKNAEDRKVLSRALNKAIQAVSKAKAGSRPKPGNKNYNARYPSAIIHHSAI